MPLMRNGSAFTLIELLVVVAVIAVLLALGLLAVALPASAHESREVEPYVLVFGLRNEPVYNGLRSGPEVIRSLEELPGRVDRNPPSPLPPPSGR